MKEREREGEEGGRERRGWERIRNLSCSDCNLLNRCIKLHSVFYSVAPVLLFPPSTLVLDCTHLDPIINSNYIIEYNVANEYLN